MALQSQLEAFGTSGSATPARKMSMTSDASLSTVGEDDEYEE